MQRFAVAAESRLQLVERVYHGWIRSVRLVRTIAGLVLATVVPFQPGIDGENVPVVVQSPGTLGQRPRFGMAEGRSTADPVGAVVFAVSERGPTCNPVGVAGTAHGVIGFMGVNVEGGCAVGRSDDRPGQA